MYGRIIILEKYLPNSAEAKYGRASIKVEIFCFSFFFVCFLFMSYLKIFIFFFHQKIVAKTIPESSQSFLGGVAGGKKYFVNNTDRSI